MDPGVTFGALPAGSAAINHSGPKARPWALGFLKQPAHVICGGLLYYKYKGKLSSEEKYIKERKKKQYLFQKLHQLSYEKQKESQQLITNLPLIDKGPAP